MNGTNLIDSCQTYLPVQYASSIELIRRRVTDVVIDSEPHPSSTCKTSLIVCSVGCRVFVG